MMLFKVAYTDEICFYEQEIRAKTPYRAMRGVLDSYAQSSTLMPVYDGLMVAYWEIVKVSIGEESYEAKVIGKVSLLDDYEEEDGQEENGNEKDPKDSTHVFTEKEIDMIEKKIRDILKRSCAVDILVRRMTEE